MLRLTLFDRAALNFTLLTDVGYLDDVIILPLGILLAIRLMPPLVLEESQLKASEWERHVKRPVSKVTAVLIVLIWLTALAGI